MKTESIGGFATTNFRNTVIYEKASSLKSNKLDDTGKYHLEEDYEHNDESPSDPPPNRCRIRKCWTTMDASLEPTLSPIIR